MTTKVTPETIARRFWSFVDKDGPIVRAELGPCWVWTGGRREGYGAFSIRRSTIGAHIVSWEMANGREVRPGFKVCHRCDNRPCVRDSHLFEGTQSENLIDCVNKGRHVAPRGERNGMAKLTEVQVLSVYDGAQDAEMRRWYAKWLGISQSLISEIRNGNRWRHVTLHGQELT